MTRDAIIQKTVQTMQMLPKEKAQEIFEFANFLMKKYENQILQKGIEVLTSDEQAFSMLNNEEDFFAPVEEKETP
ncbi:hypothetical protein V9K67_11370 [Paraflavisolibacter sp. H34]|uniref:hypothetical protein n=1 Tax=Huijunlia imazamoxiresistens TaxID=3127457 RepID=UPI003018CEE4